MADEQRREEMSDLISRQAALDALQHEWDGMVLSVFDCINNLPSAELLTEEDYTELRHRFGDKVASVVRDMVKRKGKRWKT